MKKNYEAYIIFDGNLDDSKIEELLTKYENLFKKNNVDIKNIDRIGRRRLAYSIQGKLNGYYVCFEMLSPPDYIVKLERTYKLDEEVLRHLTIYMDKKTLGEKEDYLKKKALFAEKLELEKKEAEKVEIKEEAIIEQKSDVQEN